MLLCKAKVQDGTPCPNQVDKGQKYCPYHLASQVGDEKKKVINALSGLGIVAAGVGIWKFAKPGIITVAKYVAKIKF